jgi:hypothetical protein
MTIVIAVALGSAALGMGVVASLTQVAALTDNDDKPVTTAGFKASPF